MLIELVPPWQGPIWTTLARWPAYDVHTSALCRKGFCDGVAGFCILSSLSRQLAVGRAETCESGAEESGGVVLELTATAMVRSSVECTVFHFTFHFGCFSRGTLFMGTHSV